MVRSRDDPVADCIIVNPGPNCPDVKSQSLRSAAIPARCVVTIVPTLVSGQEGSRLSGRIRGPSAGGEILRYKCEH